MQQLAAIGRVLRDAIFLSIIVFLVGFIFLLWSHDSGTASTRPLMYEVARDFGIVLCSIGLISILYELLIRRLLIADYNNALRELIDPDTKKLGVSALFRDREDKTMRARSIDALLRAMRKEMICIGLGFYQFLPEKRDLLLAKLKEGCSFRFLIFDTESKNAAALDESLGDGDGSLLTFLRAQRSYFDDFIGRLPSYGIAESNFQVRLYDSVPTFGALQLDPAQPGGRMIIEFYGHRVEGAVCPGAEVTEGSSWYTFYDRQMAALWGDGKVLSVARPAPAAQTAQQQKGP
jgi:hypothetical protein